MSVTMAGNYSYKHINDVCLKHREEYLDIRGMKYQGDLENYIRGNFMSRTLYVFRMIIPRN